MAKPLRTKESADIQNHYTIKWYNDNFKNIEKTLKTNQPITFDSNIEHNLLGNNYYSISIVKNHPYYIPRTLKSYVKTRQDEKLFLNALMYAVSINDHAVAKFVFTQCKYRGKVRNKSLTSLDRFDTFYCHIAADSGVYRHNGTLEGAALIGQVRDSTIRRHNITMLNMLSSGHCTNNLSCAVSGEAVEAISRFNPVIDELSNISAYEIHHAYYIDKTSFYLDLKDSQLTRKIYSPSTMLNAFKYENFTEQLWTEFMSCIVLSSGEHSILHIMCNKGGIKYWINGYKNGHYKSIPYAWKSENNYNEILQWIKSVSPGVDLTKFPTYDKFISIHSQ